MKYWISDRITIWYIPTRCSFACSVTSYPQLCDPINIRRVTANNAQCLVLFHSNSKNIDQITKWRIGGERACKPASFTYISYCDTIRTQVPNWSQNSEFAKFCNQPINRNFSVVQSFDGAEHAATVPVRLQPGPGTKLQIWNGCYHKIILFWSFRLNYWMPVIFVGKFLGCGCCVSPSSSDSSPISLIISSAGGGRMSPRGR